MANEDLVRLLKNDVSLWIDTMRLAAVGVRERDADADPYYPYQRPHRTADLRGADLRGLELQDVTFDGADLEGADLSGSTLYESSFYQANLSKATMVSTNLMGSDFTGACLRGSNLSHCNLIQATLGFADACAADFSDSALDMAHAEFSRLHGARLSQARLRQCTLSGAELKRAECTDADFSRADLREANLHGATLSGARLVEANLRGACIRRADLRSADLTGANLANVDLTLSCLDGARVHGVAAWNVRLDHASQKGLMITSPGEATITVEDIEVAQLVHLLLRRDNFRRVMQTVTSKMVLVLGRFTPPRKQLLDKLVEALRTLGYVSIVFDFDPPTTRDVGETLSILGHLSRFVIVDLTDPRSVPQELQTLVPHLPSVPIVPILEQNATEFGMFPHFARYPWVLSVHRYQNSDELVNSIQTSIVGPAETKLLALRSNERS